MQKIKVGDKLQVHCYKHDGSLHRICDEATVLEISEDYIICANDKTRITEKEDFLTNKYHSYITKEPAILFFYKKQWYNIIAQIKKNGLYYYCNIASPYIIDDGLIKYIDYDLDLRIFSDGAFKILDRNEYNYNKKRLKYSKELDYIINNELSSLINSYKNKTAVFRKDTIKSYYELYFSLKNEKNGQ